MFVNMNIWIKCPCYVSTSCPNLFSNRQPYKFCCDCIKITKLGKTSDRGKSQSSFPVSPPNDCHGLTATYTTKNAEIRISVLVWSCTRNNIHAVRETMDELNLSPRVLAGLRKGNCCFYCNTRESAASTVTDMLISFLAGSAWADWAWSLTLLQL